jgi:PKD repeat protein
MPQFILVGGGFSAPPVNTVLPAISGTAQVGETLTTTDGTWTNSPSGYAYQWKSAGSNVGTDQNTYVPVTGDIGNTITVVVTASNGGGSTPATSDATSAVLPAEPIANFTGTPLSGTAPLTVAFTYTGTGGTPDDYDWEKNDGGGWVAFDGTPTAEDPTEDFAAGTWSVRVTASNGGGSDTHTETDYIEATAAPSGGGTGSTRLALRLGLGL